jgi:hypothetical protein
MGWLFFLAAILCLAFPPVGVVVLAMIVLGIFTKGIVADAHDPLLVPRPRTRHRRRAESRRDAVDSHGNELHGEVIDVTSYPVHPPLPLPTTVPKPQGE